MNDTHEASREELLPTPPNPLPKGASRLFKYVATDPSPGASHTRFLVNEAFSTLGVGRDVWRTNFLTAQEATQSWLDELFIHWVLSKQGYETRYEEESGAPDIRVYKDGVLIGGVEVFSLCSDPVTEGRLWILNELLEAVNSKAQSSGRHFALTLVRGDHLRRTPPPRKEFRDFVNALLQNGTPPNSMGEHHFVSADGVCAVNLLETNNYPTTAPVILNSHCLSAPQPKKSPVTVTLSKKHRSYKRHDAPLLYAGFLHVQDPSLLEAVAELAGSTACGPGYLNTLKTSARDMSGVVIYRRNPWFGPDYGVWASVPKDPAQAPYDGVGAPSPDVDVVLIKETAILVDNPRDLRPWLASPNLWDIRLSTLPAGGTSPSWP